MQLSRRITIQYPDSTIVDPGPLVWTTRKITVLRVRDLLAQPLTPAEFLRRPLLNRGRYLIDARDERTGQFRRFYMATAEQFSQPILRIGLFDRSRRLPVTILEEFPATRRERLLAARLVTDLLAYDFGPLRVGIYADDLFVNL